MATSRQMAAQMDLERMSGIVMNQTPHGATVVLTAVVITAVHVAALHPRQQRNHLGAVFIGEPPQRLDNQFMGQAACLNNEDDMFTIWPTELGPPRAGRVGCP